jgi:acyl-CoA reductase-like NAD-dependent aldehyde dehydrogenase
MVMVNLPTAGVDYHVAFGGRKGSSYGAREQGSYAKEFYTIIKRHTPSQCSETSTSGDYGNSDVLLG